MPCFSQHPKDYSSYGRIISELRTLNQQEIQKPIDNTKNHQKRR